MNDPDANKVVIADSDIKVKFIIDSRYFAKGVGLILGGTVLKGTIKLNQEMMFGPDRNGMFKPVVIKGIHENRCEISEAGEMSSICVNVKVPGKNPEPIKNNHIRKGSCLINPVNSKTKGYN
jgi:GTPase